MKDLIRFIFFIIITYSFINNASELKFVNEKGEFKTTEYKSIVEHVLKNFVKECGIVSSIEKNQVAKIANTFDIVQKMDSKLDLAKSCYREQISVLSSRSFIYSRICNELTYKGIPSKDLLLMRSFVAVEKYKSGIELNHTLLNDCLKKSKVDEKYVVKIINARFSTEALSRRLNQMKLKIPMFENRIQVR